MSCEDPREVIDPRRIVFRVLCGPSLLAAGPHLIDFMKSVPPSSPALLVATTLGQREKSANPTNSDTSCTYRYTIKTSLLSIDRTNITSNFLRLVSNCHRSGSGDLPEVLNRRTAFWA